MTKDSASGEEHRDAAPPRPAISSNPPRILIIGAGSRGNAYARAVKESTNGIVVAVAEPIKYKRHELGRKYIWGEQGPTNGQEYDSWKDFVQSEKDRRGKFKKGQQVPEGIDGVFVCTLDEMHAEIITGLAPLELHIMSEKPLATTIRDCLEISCSLMSKKRWFEPSPAIFAIGHVLRYSPHNMLLRKLLQEEEVIGEILSIEHTEPVGWWHFSHSYVRGNWRKESVTAPSLLTKSCHDIDLILWLLSVPKSTLGHLPAFLTSTGSLYQFRKARKPVLAGNATNCLSCPAEKECIYSANKIYHERHLSKGNADWPVKIVDPEIEDCLNLGDVKAAEDKLFKRLREDYSSETSMEERDSRPWFGRCVYEADNDVCDDQIVTMTWEDDPLSEEESSKPDLPTRLHGRGAKTATFHMVASTEKICQRRTRIYGTKGEIEADSRTINVHDFATGHTKTHYPHLAGGGHGGGDDGLARQFVLAINAVKNQSMSVIDAQLQFIGCDTNEMVRSHMMVFAAEEARKKRKIVSWNEWWQSEVMPILFDIMKRNPKRLEPDNEWKDLQKEKEQLSGIRKP
ncbi:MAG: hypothetical protein M1827_002715 [Pycnora praestabilis]|nr:MAG: hypothetical protein M1827_002715 [Pycnora praestabilis]